VFPQKFTNSPKLNTLKFPNLLIEATTESDKKGHPERDREVNWGWCWAYVVRDRQRRREGRRGKKR
jgi:hypothetical protein